MSASVAKKMVDYRKSHGYSLGDMSKKSGASTSLLKMLEGGMVTHPKIAKQVGRAYGLTKEEIYELMPAIHRPGDPAYDPNKYKEPDEVTGSNKNMDWLFTPNTRTEGDIYIAEHQKRMKKEHQRRGIY